jgi:hypothetical protein
MNQKKVYEREERLSGQRMKLLGVHWKKKRVEVREYANQRIRDNRIMNNSASVSENPSYEISVTKLVICVNYPFRNI